MPLGAPRSNECYVIGDEIWRITFEMLKHSSSILDIVYSFQQATLYEGALPKTLLNVRGTL